MVRRTLFTAVLFLFYMTHVLGDELPAENKDSGDLPIHHWYKLTHNAGRAFLKLKFERSKKLGNLTDAQVKALTEDEIRAINEPLNEYEKLLAVFGGVSGFEILNVDEKVHLRRVYPKPARPQRRSGVGSPSAGGLPASPPVTLRLDATSEDLLTLNLKDPVVLYGVCSYTSPPIGGRLRYKRIQPQKGVELSCYARRRPHPLSFSMDIEYVVIADKKFVVLEQSLKQVFRGVGPSKKRVEEKNPFLPK